MQTTTCKIPINVPKAPDEIYTMQPVTVTISEISIDQVQLRVHYLRYRFFGKYVQEQLVDWFQKKDSYAAEGLQMSSTQSTDVRNIIINIQFNQIKLLKL